MIIRKIKSLIVKIKERKYRNSSTWKNHPLNKILPSSDFRKIDEELKGLSTKLFFDFKPLIVEPGEYWEFKKRFQVSSLYAIGYKDKKILEHFISYKLNKIKKNDIYIDVASENSPFPELFSKIVGADAYSQDLTYKKGIHGKRIGSSADSLPLQDNSVDCISLQCAFEHFQEDIDIRFVMEVKRVLKVGGKCCIVPLYLSNIYQNIVDPLSVYSAIKFDDGATIIAEVALGGNFERIYSPDALRRILVPDIGLKYTIYRVSGLEKVFEHNPRIVKRVRYVLFIEKQ